MIDITKKSLQIDAEWTDDCSGKKNFDGNIISIDTRYWPRGGGFMTFDTSTNEFDNGEISRSHILPSANSSLRLYYKEDANSDGYDPGYVDLATMKFEAETEAEVKQLVETWANEQMRTIVSLVSSHYKSNQK